MSVMNKPDCLGGSSDTARVPVSDFAIEWCGSLCVRIRRMMIPGTPPPAITWALCSLCQVDRSVFLTYTSVSVTYTSPHRQAKGL